ncbi:MAG: hypothetical protein HY866_18480 [Chloroflexi bacterium]|nr:hypothetical protein [Chloroflexota bacterium]
MTPVTVRKVENKTDLNTFITLPWKIYKDNPYWTPPLLSMQRHKLDRDKNPTWKHLEGDYFVAWRGDQPVGTIAAFINHRHNEYHNERIGFFGFFEVYDDQEAAHALLKTAADYVKAKGYTALRGPASFSTNDECGLLIQGFEDEPVVAYPYNPAYYQSLIESMPGFVKVMDTNAYYLTLSDAGDSEKIQKMLRINQKNNERRGIVVHAPNRRDLKAEFVTLKDIYNSAWDKNWGFVPLTNDELDALVKDMSMYIDPRVTLFATVNGEPAGFLLAVPDLFQAVHLAHPRPGKPEIFSLVQVLWYWKVRRKISRIRIPFMGVKEKFRGIGVEAAMFTELFHRATAIAPKMGWDYGDGGWVLETNEPMHRLVEANRGYVYKRFRFYQLEMGE